MRLVEDDHSKDAEKAQADEDFERFVKERDALPSGSPAAKAAQEKVMEAYDRMYALDMNYFRLNIAGMSAMRELMFEMGMLAHEYDHNIQWPKVEDFGLTNDEWWNFDEDEITDETPENLLKFRDAHNACLSWSPPDEPGIPVHKLGSNDGWFVTPRDCESALAKAKQFFTDEPERYAELYAQWDQESGGNYFDAWLEFLKRGQAHGGFRVY